MRLTPPARLRVPLSWLLGAVLMLLPHVSSAQAGPNDFRWEGRLAAGQTLEIRGVQGSIRAEAAAGDRIEVIARKHARRGDVEEVEIEVVPHASGVTICAMYPVNPRASRENSCGPGNNYSMSTNNSQVNVDFTVRVPAGVRLTATTFSGNIDVQGLRSYVDASTMSGDVRIVTSEAASARTMSGSVSASIGTLAGQERFEFKSMSGSVEVELPASSAARLQMTTMSGRLETDFPISVEGRFSPRRVEGTIAGGGPLLVLSTMSGNIRVRRGR